MPIIVGVLAVLLLFSVLGFLIHLLWIASLILFALWFVGFVVSRNHPHRRWYRW